MNEGAGEQICPPAHQVSVKFRKVRICVGNIINVISLNINRHQRIIPSVKYIDFNPVKRSSVDIEAVNSKIMHLAGKSSAGDLIVKIRDGVPCAAEVASLSVNTLSLRNSFY